MSISIVLVPLAIALTITVNETAIDFIKNQNNLSDDLQPMPTIYNDISLLEKTLVEHGLPTLIESQNQLICQLDKIRLCYSRNSIDDPFYVSVSGVSDMNNLISELQILESEYMNNVQSYTYHKLISKLNENNMSLESEAILEDNSILLTINI